MIGRNPRSGGGIDLPPLLLLGLLAAGACSPAPAPDEVRRLLDLGDEEAAEGRARAHVDDASARYGEESMPAAAALDLLVEARLRRGLADDETRALAERALRIKEGDPAAGPLDRAVSVLQLAQARARGDPAGALPLAEEARDLRLQALGPDDPVVAEALAVEALCRLLQGDAGGGGAAAERSLAIRRAVLGSGREVADSLILVSYAAQQGGDRDRAVELRREAVAMRERALGPWHPDTGGALLALGEILIHRRDPEARPVLERALEVLEHARGPADRGARIALNNLALVVQGQGDLPYARHLYERRLSLPGAGGMADLAAWQNLGSVLWQMGELRAAREAYETAVALVTESGAPPEGLAIHQHNLAFVLTLEGRYAEARELLETALAAQIAAHGPDDRRALAGLDALGNVMRQTGDLREARRLYERALESLARNPSTSPADGATLRFHLGEVRWGLGDRDGARRDMEQALAWLEERQSPDSPDVAVALDKLSDLLLEMGEREEARRHLERLRTLHAKQQGRAGARVARVEARLAEIEGDPDRRIEMLAAARRRLAAQYGPGHPDVAALDVRRARALADSGEVDAARRLLEGARRVQQEVFGPFHPETARTELEIGRLALRQGDRATALELALRGEAAGLEQLRTVIGGLPEREALALARTRPTGLDLAASVAAAAPEDGALVGEVWNAVIRGRGRVLDEMASRERLARLTRSPDLAARAAALTEARSWLARLLVQGPGSDDPGDYLAKVADARTRTEEAERALAEGLEPFRDARARDGIGWAEVAASLPPRSALVAFTRYQAPAGRYLALVQAPGAEPRGIALGNSGEIDAAVASWRDEISVRPPPGRPAQERAEARYLEAARALTRAVWEPLTQALGEVETVFVVPDGALFRVSFPTLPLADGSYLLESGPRIHLLGTERDLAGMGSPSPPGHGLLAVGAPEFGDPPESTTSDGARCGALGTIAVPSLPGAEQEAEAIAALWDRRSEPAADRLTGAAATEESVREHAPGRRVLHFATHGFVLEGNCREGRSEPEELPPADPWARSYEPGGDPLALSGLALAGFNHRDLADASEDDGVLTAGEIASLDLSGVEWAVLSACDTGSGRIQAREGVIGLERAFRTAGVHSLVLSLWPVEDEATRAWMERLYGSRAAGASTAEAVQAASLETLRERRRLGLGGHPFYWGAFVATGDWR